MKQRGRYFIGYVVFLVVLFVPLIGGASFTNSNNQIAALERYSEKNFFVTNNVSEKVVNTVDTFVNFLPVRKAPPVLNGNIVGQALASNASLLNWNRPTADLEIEKIIVYRTVSADGNGMLPSVGTEVELAGNSTHYVDGDVETGVTYEYAIKAVDIAGNESEVSNVVAITTNEGYDGVHNADRVVGKVTSTEATLNTESLFSNESKVLGFYRGLFGGELIWENISAYNTADDLINVKVNAGFLHHFVVVPLDLDGNILSAGEIITVAAPPHAPGDLQAVKVSHNFVTLQWENTNNLENMPESVVTEIYRYDSWSDDPDDLNFLIELNVENNTFTDLGVKFGQEYTYAVRVRVGADNRSEFSNIVKVITLLPEVGNLQTGDIGAASIEITWENAINDPTVVEGKEIIHDIYRNGDKIDEVNGIDNSFADNGLDTLTDYKYHIVTRSNNSNSHPSGKLEVTTRPYAVSNLRATYITTDSITLEWDDPNNREDVAYLVYRDNRKVGEVDDSVFTNSRLGSISSHNYEVIIRVGENESLSSSINVTTRPHAPQNLIATEITSDSVTLEWKNDNDLTDVIGDVFNEIYRDGAYIDKVAGSDQTFTDSTVVQGNTYTYTIRIGVEDNIWSDFSGEVEITVIDYLLPVTDLGVIDVTSSEIEVWWSNTVSNLNSVNHNVYVNGQSVVSLGGEVTSYRITDLNYNTEYEIYIITELRNDPSIYSKSGSIEVTTEPITITPVINLRYTSITDTEIGIAWNNTVNDMASVRHVIYVNGEYYGDVDGITTTYKITERMPGTTYKIYIITELIGDYTLYNKSSEINVTTLPPSTSGEVSGSGVEF